MSSSTPDTSLMAMFAHDLFSLTRLLTSHPIHSAYLLFFSPYILSLLSFLSPLLLSTLLSLLAVNSSHLLAEFEFKSLGKTCCIALKSLRIVPALRQERMIGVLEELDEMVLSPIAHALSGEEIMKELCISSSSSFSLVSEDVQSRDHQEVLVPKCRSASEFIINSSSCLVGGEFDQALMDGGNYEEKKKGCDANLETLLDVNNGVSSDQEESTTTIIKANLEDPKPEESRTATGTNMSSGELFDDYISCASDVEGKESESEDNADPKIATLERFTEQTDDGIVAGNGGEKKLVPNQGNQHARTPSQGLQREGSLRADKEWKRTLACKLYEERITSKLREERPMIAVKEREGEGKEGEEMDFIWEAIEANSNKSNGNNNNNNRSSTKSKGDTEEEEEDDEEEEEDMPVRHLCCLQAFRVSTRKMNLGVGRPSLLKLSKVLKKMAVFHVGGRSSRSSSKISEEKEIDVIKG